MEEKIEWVEIVEPRTGDHMFANLRTGQCLWDPPQGAKVKKTHDNQWWELYDATTRRYYYYNATSQKTVWRKPKDGDIIPLAKLQQLKTKDTTRKDAVESNSKQNNENKRTDSRGNDVQNTYSNAINNHLLITASRAEDSSDAKTGNSSDDGNNGVNAAKLRRELEVAMRLSTLPQQGEKAARKDQGSLRPDLARSSSTGDTDVDGSSPSISLTEKLKSKSLKIPRKPAPPKPPRGNLAQTSDFSITSDSDSFGSPERGFLPSARMQLPDYNGHSSVTSYLKPDYEKHTVAGGDVVDGAMISIQKNRGKSLKPIRAAPSAPQKPMNQSGIPVPPPLPPVKKAKESRRMLPTIDYDSDSSREEVKSPFSKMIDEMQEYSEHLPLSDADHLAKDKQPSSIDDSPSPSGTLLPESKHDDYSMYENVGLSRSKLQDGGSTNDVFLETENCFAERLTHMGMPASTAALVDACAPASAPGTPKPEVKGLTRIHSDSSVITRKSSSPVNGEKAAVPFRPLSLMPAHGQPRDGARPSFAGQDTSVLTKEVPLSTHRKGFFKRRRMSIASMLSWSKTPIKKPMVLTRDKQIRKEAIDVFKLSLQCMGDKASRKSNAALALDIVSKGWSTSGIRDEIYIQLCKQTTGNERKSSLQKGWELITVCLAMFPPSNKFHSYLEGYIYRHLEPESNELGVPVATYAKHCYKQLERICQSGAKRGLKRPSLEEIEQAKESVFHPSMFGNTLEDIMEMQREREGYSERRLPWIMTTLAEFVLAHDGLHTEGIFRVPGDIDEVNSLKVIIDKWKTPTTVRDPHIPASLLKLWFRDLYEPLIPNVFYERCIRNCENPTVAISIVYALPDLNSLIFCYLIRFLQAFVVPEISAVSKMDENNLAMVWAPNCLRCPSDEPMQIFENARKEMTFLRTLIKNLETSFLQGVL